MSYIDRKIKPRIDEILSRGESILLLGPRQTGKTTLLKKIPAAMNISFIAPRVRRRYEMDPSALSDEVRVAAEEQDSPPLIILDEVQKVPAIMDVAQELIDDGIAQFLLTGSSARKLKRGKEVNLLPGRVIPLHMDPLSSLEIPKAHLKLETLLIDGSLPKVILSKQASVKEELLESYVSIYLEEEIRAEAIVRNLANFAKFLELAASESGYAVNFSKLSQLIGVAHTTIADYYQILEDCLVAERIEPLTKSKTRHRLSKTQKYIFFDLGLRRVAAGEGRRLPEKYMGHLFEQYVALELIRQIRWKYQRVKVRYWRDPDGPEVDWVVDFPEKLIPIEVKYTDRPTKHDAKHLITFLDEYEEASIAYVVCRAPRKMKLADNIYALPWKNIKEVLE